MDHVKMLATIVVLSLFPVFCPAQEADTMMAEGEAYSGPNDEQMEIAYFKDGQSALLHVSGVNSPWDGKTVKAEVRNKGGADKDYVIENDGNHYVMITRRLLEVQSLSMSVPGYPNNPVPLTYDMDASGKLQPQQMLAVYNRSLSNGAVDQR